MAEGYHGVHQKLVGRFGTKGDALYTFVACALALVVSGLAAWLFKQPLLFPSLGPTALLFFEQPLAAPSSPRNTLIGHLVAILAGAISLALFGLLDHPSVLTEGVTLARTGAAALSLAFTGALLLLLRSSHPPTRATAHREFEAPADSARDVDAGVLILSVVGRAINRAHGVPVPLWLGEGCAITGLRPEPWRGGGGA